MATITAVDSLERLICRVSPGASLRLDYSTSQGWRAWVADAIVTKDEPTGRSSLVRGHGTTTEAAIAQLWDQMTDLSTGARLLVHEKYSHLTKRWDDASGDWVVVD